MTDRTASSWPGRRRRSTSQTYDRLASGYTQVRRSDPRIAAQLHRRLGTTSPIINVGAGAGSYEPRHRQVVAVEPSTEMLAHRRPEEAPVVRASADALAFRDRVFGSAIAVLTLHHWPDAAVGLAELRRVTDGPVVVMTFDHAFHDQQWLTAEYLPAIAELDPDVPSPAAMREALGGGVVEEVAVRHDCVDGFLHAYWRRPEAYLDPKVRAGISGIARLPARVVEPAMARLSRDIETGAWHQAHGDLLDREEVDVGYRIVVGGGR